MPKPDPQLPVAATMIERRIHLIRGHRVMLDSDLAELYGVTTGNLNKAVSRNLVRFPEDFMFKLTGDEYAALRFQFGSLKRGQHAKYLPKVFTEQGVAMLSSVLNSERAAFVNIAIMRAFVKMREVMSTHKELANKIEALERKYRDHDDQIQVVFKAIKQLLEPAPQQPKRRIGFKASGAL